jgi:integrase
MARLTDAAVRALKKKDKPYRVTDGAGLYVYVSTEGTRSFRWNYTFGGKAKTATFGVFPDVGLSEARQRHQAARASLAAGIDPGEAKREDKRKREAAVRDTFGAVSEELIARKLKAGKRPATIQHLRLMRDLLKPLHNRPISAITTPELLAALRKIEERARASALRARGFANAVFSVAVIEHRATFNPAQPLARSNALEDHKERPTPAITERKAFGQLLRDVDTLLNPTTRNALTFLALTGLRTHEARLMEWSHVDFERQSITIPAAHVKTGNNLLIPMSRQVAALLRSQQGTTGKKAIVFGSLGGAEPFHRATLLKALIRLGYDGKHVPHGFRATFSTLANESGMWSPDAIEISAGRKDSNDSRRRYNRSDRWDERVKLMAWWASQCDQMRANLSVVGGSQVLTSS